MSKSNRRNFKLRVTPKIYRILHKMHGGDEVIAFNNLLHQLIFFAKMENSFEVTEPDFGVKNFFLNLSVSDNIYIALAIEFTLANRVVEMLDSYCNSILFTFILAQKINNINKSEAIRRAMKYYNLSEDEYSFESIYQMCNRHEFGKGQGGSAH